MNICKIWRVVFGTKKSDLGCPMSPVLLMIRAAIQTGDQAKLRAIFGLMNPRATDAVLHSLDHIERQLVLAALGVRIGAGRVA